MNNIQKLSRLVSAYENWPTWLLHRYLPVDSPWKLVTRNGCSISIREDEPGDAAVAGESWQYGIHDFLLPYMENAKVGIDLGAHIGTFTLWASKHSPAKIYAFEPAEKNLKTLKENVHSNGLDDRVRIVPLIVSSQTGTKDLYITKNSSFVSTVKEWSDGKDESGGVLNAVKAPSICLEDFFKKEDIDVCDFMKIDVEGGEYDILMNLPDSVYARIRSMSVEICSRVDEIVNHAKSKGFNCVQPCPEIAATEFLFTK